MFIDKAKLTIKSGKGGDGAIAFHHEKFVERGGPSGGNGGRGGSIYFVASNNSSTLINYRHARKVVAKDGEKGMAKKMYGAKSDDIYLEVPVGTVIFQEPEHIFLADMDVEGKVYLAAKGGRGGRGNACFATSRNRCPRVAENGLPGIEKVLTLELKLLADVGLVGLPSVGKSTLLSVVSNAKPEIADYPFTTIIPNLGIVKVDDNSFVLADLPGLIEGASVGKGLGLTFLRHIERCKVLIHVLDIEHEDPLDDFKKINNELAQYGFNLIKRPMLVAINKVEDDESLLKANKIKEELVKEGYEVFFISSILHENINELMKRTYEVLQTAPSFPLYENNKEEVKVYNAYEEAKKEYEVVRTGPHAYQIRGEKIERTYSLINLSTDEGISKLLSILRNLGVDDTLKEMGLVDGDIVTLCDFEFEYFN